MALIMTDYNSFSHYHLADIFFAMHAGAKKLMAFVRSVVFEK